MAHTSIHFDQTDPEAQRRRRLSRQGAQDRRIAIAGCFGFWALALYLGGALWIGHGNSIEIQQASQENFRATPRSITMAEVSK